MKEKEMFFLVPRRDKEMFPRVQFSWFLVDKGVPGCGTEIVHWQRVVLDVSCSFTGSF